MPSFTVLNGRLQWRRLQSIWPWCSSVGLL
jgi:hypothetical protein